MPSIAKPNDKYPRSLTNEEADARKVCYSCESDTHLRPHNKKCINNTKHVKKCRNLAQPGQSPWELLNYPRAISDLEADERGVCWSCQQPGHIAPWNVNCVNKLEYRPFEVSASPNPSDQAAAEPLLNQAPPDSQQPDDDSDATMMDLQAGGPVPEADEEGAVHVEFECTQNSTQDPASLSQVHHGTRVSPRAKPPPIKYLVANMDSKKKSYDDSMTDIATGNATNLFPPGKQLRKEDESDGDDEDDDDTGDDAATKEGTSSAPPAKPLRLRIPNQSRGKQLPNQSRGKQLRHPASGGSSDSTTEPGEDDSRGNQNSSDAGSEGADDKNPDPSSEGADDKDPEPAAIPPKEPYRPRGRVSFCICDLLKRTLIFEITPHS